MSDRSSWWCGFYANPEDKQLLVQRPNPRMGWTINIAHPAVGPTIGALGGVIWLIPLLWVVVLRWSILASSSPTVLWYLGSMIGSLIAFGLNPFSFTSRRFVLRGVAFGMIAALVGFAFQSCLNIPIVAAIGKANLTWRTHLYLGATASIAQTAGKLLLIAGLIQATRMTDTKDKKRAGLLVGLGFTVFEITMLWISVLAAGLPITSLIGVWERASASLFHIYSGGLLALFLIDKRSVYLGIVILIHFGMDWLAGANATLTILTPLQFESVVSVFATVVWLTFVVVGSIESRKDRSPAQ